MTNVLVAYATRNGSTREVAEAIGAVAHSAGAGFEVTPAHAVVGPLTGVDLVILGAPIYSGRWHRDAHRFLRRHEEELATFPLAVFALGPRDNDESAWQHSWRQFHRALAKRRRIQPIAMELFGGADPAGRGRPGRRDLRDWTAIGAWTRNVMASAPRSTGPCRCGTGSARTGAPQWRPVGGTSIRSARASGSGSPVCRRRPFAEVAAPADSHLA